MDTQFCLRRSSIRSLYVKTKTCKEDNSKEPSLRPEKSRSLLEMTTERGPGSEEKAQATQSSQGAQAPSTHFSNIHERLAQAHRLEPLSGHHTPGLRAAAGSASPPYGAHFARHHPPPRQFRTLMDFSMSFSLLTREMEKNTLLCPETLPCKGTEHKIYLVTKINASLDVTLYVCVYMYRYGWREN